MYFYSGNAVSCQSWFTGTPLRNKEKQIIKLNVTDLKSQLAGGKPAWRDGA